MNFYVELRKSRNLFARQRWSWRAKGRNHEILAQGESYVDKASAQDTIALLFGPDVEVVELRTQF